MEELLNKLIEKGWKPFGEYDRIMAIGRYNGKRVFDFGVLGEVEYSIRELVSRESGLWQFVCENGMCVAGERPYRGKFYEELFPDYEAQTYSNNMIIESSLKDESELEDFLLNSIKLD